MKSLVELLRMVLLDCGDLCGVNPSQDITTILRRVEYEGESFLTITLPEFSRGLERSLEDSRLQPSTFPSFKRWKRTCLPAFLRGFMSRIFDSNGTLLEEPDPIAVYAVRQICLFAKKILIPCTKERERRAETRFLQCEKSLKGHVYDRAMLRVFESVSRVIVGDTFGRTSYGDPYQALRPRHGPGTTQEGLRGNRKYRFPSWPVRVERVFPYTEFAIASVRNFPGGVHFPALTPEPRDEEPVRVVFVPKTLKTPRVIAIEPVAMMFMQQGLSDWMRPLIEDEGRYTAGHIRFTDQSVNSSLALTSSADRRLATIDMSDASDLVPCVLVERMLRCVPTLRRYVFACRSSRARLPSGDVIPLRKFASMGSALCFPMEALVFFVAIVSVLIHRAGVRVTPSAVLKFSRGVHVYGDDIIVPAEMAPSVCDGLELYGFKVNTAKSFWSGNFRESCGMDAFNGSDVTPTYCRRLLPTSRADVGGIVSAVSLSNQLYKAGLWRAAWFVRQAVERLLGTLPLVSDTSPVVGWHSFSNAVSYHGWSNEYQRLKTRGWVVVAKRAADSLSEDAALLKCFGLIGRETVEPEHLSTSVRFGNLALKRRWI